MPKARSKNEKNNRMLMYYGCYDVFAFFLFYPWSKKVYEDGGTTIYSSLTYELIIWRTIGRER